MILTENEVALWLQPVGEATEKPEKILDNRELQRYQRIASPAKKAEFFSSRLLLKKILHHYLPEKADSIHSLTDSFGRPFWYIGKWRLPLYFSLSHTKGVIACAVAGIAEIGCDIELIRPRRYEAELAAKVLGKSEMCHYQKQENREYARQFFYRCWTLKEAYLKAKGIGIRAPLTEIDFGCASLSSCFCAFSSDKETEGNWQFHQQFLPAGFSLALATSCNSKIILQKNFLKMLLSPPK